MVNDHKILLSCRNLAYKVGKGDRARALVSGVDLDVAPGHLVGLIGPNGAGKSTLLRLLSGWTRPSEGRVELDGRPLEAWTPRERAHRLGVVTQEIPQGFPFTVRELVEMGRFPHGTWLGRLGPDDRSLVRDVIRYVGLEDRMDQTFPTLSGGEKQRALFARALAQGSPVLLLDEPSASLDLAQEHRLFGMLRELAQEGTAVVVAVHDINVAAEYCHHLVLMAGGRLVAQGRPEEVLTVANLERWFDAPVMVGRNEVTGAVQVQYRPAPGASRPGRVHVIGGAGSGRQLTRLLVRLGYEVSGGIAHGLDHDAALWEALDIPMVRVEPFSHVDDEAFARARALVEAADLTVLCDFPFGPGNRRNMDLLAHARRVWVMDDEGGSDEGGTTCHRDFWLPGLEEAYGGILENLAAQGRLEHGSWTALSRLLEHYRLVPSPGPLD